jgi:ankyrin repeat protein
MEHQNVKLAEALLAEGAPVDARDKDGYTPLLWAANRGAVRLVELLLARGADVNAKTTDAGNAGRTALMLGPRRRDGAGAARRGRRPGRGR